MKERPILFSGPMVRAILEGRKTQTRRLIKPQPPDEWSPEVGIYAPTCIDRRGEEYPGEDVFGASDESHGRVFPYGEPGDRLWVRETWARHEPYPSGEHVTNGQLELPQVDVRKDETLFKYWGERVVYRADFDRTSPCDLPDKGQYDEHWRPSIFMPRWASRITLEITDVRVQRLQEIDYLDAYAEGIPEQGGNSSDGAWRVTNAFKGLWDSINSKRGFGWDVNPWIWAITFRRMQ